MTALRRPLLAFVLGLALLLGLLVLSSLGTSREPPAKRTVQVQNVQLYSPTTPPKSPEPVKRASGGAASRDLSVKIPQRTPTMALMALDTSAASAVALPTGYGQGGNLVGKGIGTGEGDGDGSGIAALFSAAQLDAMPMVLSAPLFLFPETLRRRGVKSFQVMLHIIVDEQGHTTPVRVVQSPDPSLNDKLLDYASHVQFSPPMRASKSVKAQYLWPVVFTDTTPVERWRAR